MESLTRLAGGLVLAACLLAGPGVAGPAEAPEVASARAALEAHAKEPFDQSKREEALRDLGRLGGADAAALVASVLEDPFVHLADHAVSAWIAMLGGPRAEETETWLGKEALRDRRDAVRRGAAVALGVRGGRDAPAWLAGALETEASGPVAEAIADALARRGDGSVHGALRRALAHRDPAAAGAAARALGRLMPHGSADDLRAAALAKDPLRRAGAVDGLAAAAPDALLDLAASLARDPATEPRIALADALEAMAVVDLARTCAVLATLLADRSWRVRAAAYEGSVAVWHRDVVPVLLAAFHRETGRLRRDASRALGSLTGEVQLGQDASVWQAWWATKGPTIDLGRKPTPDRFGRRTSPRTASGAAAEGETRTASFFRLPIESERVAFLFDFSGSMRDPAEDGGAATKADRARAEIGTTLASLRRETAFDLFLYRYPSVFPPAPRMGRALGRPSPASPGNVRRAVDWIAKEEPRGWGAIYDALVLVAQEDFDTIVLLSDGVPSRGTYDRAGRLVDEFRRANRFRRVAVDTVLVGTKGADRTFMGDLAQATGGRFEDAGRARR